MIDDMTGNVISFETNNRGLMIANQTCHGGNVIVEVSHMENGNREYDSGFTIPPKDFVMLMNYYRIQKSRGNPIL